MLLSHSQANCERAPKAAHLNWLVSIGIISSFGAALGLCKTDRVPKVPRKKPVSPPLVCFKEDFAGRETLAAIAESRVEAFHPLAHRAPASTQLYGDRISNAPGAVSPKTQRALDDAPDVSVSFLPAGRETSAAIDLELGGDLPQIEVHEELEEIVDFEEAPSRALTSVRALVIEQQHVFIVRTLSERLEDPDLKAHLLKQRLLPHLPGKPSLDEVCRVVVEPHGEGASLVRIWTQLK